MFKQYRAEATAVAADDYELQYSGKVNDIIPVWKYRSRKTGLRIVVAEVQGPLVNGYLCLATEASDDDGLPHTLEHLIFLGSEDYPFKGVLDLLANRCLASGTNAWTDTDHTCYTMTTAGSVGFLNLLPVYLDHILYPLLTSSGYTTEVHHIDGDGEDAGVVYCEMQSRENSGESRVHLALLRAMYPGNCGYKYETGGIMHNLRTSTSHTKVKNYHHKFYCPENLYLIITGTVEPQQVLETVNAFEKKIIGKELENDYERPWQSEVPPLEENVEIIEKYPSDEEENGLVAIGWRGPLSKEQSKLAAVMVLLEYLTDTAVAPLQRQFVELSEPYCSDVRYSVIENSESCININFENVAVAKLHDVRPRLFSILRRLVTDDEALDMERMHTVVHRHVLSSMSNLEDDPHNTVAFHVIGEFLYGNTAEDMDVRLNLVNIFRQLDKEPRQFWVDLINSYLLNSKYVAVIGMPSKDLMEEMGTTEKKRLASQAEELGENGLSEKQKELDNAVEQNEKPAPSELLTLFDVPDVSSIHFHSITPSSNHADSTHPANPMFPLADIPVTFQLDDIKTNFVMLTVLMDTTCVPISLRAYLPLYLELITESPLLRDGVVIPHEDVINELAADSLSNSTSLGAVSGKRFFCGYFSSLASLSLKVEFDKYLKGVRWLNDLLYGVQFSAERIHIVANKILNDVAKLKRSGRKIAETLMRAVTYKEDCNQFIAGMMRQHKFLSEVVDKLATNDGREAVLKSLKDIQSLLTSPSNLRVHMAAHVERLSAHLDDISLVKVWISEFIPPGITSAADRPVVHNDAEFVKCDGVNGEFGNTGLIVGVGSVESSFLIQWTKCLSDFDDPDFPAVLVFIQYLTQCEGPMWKEIRGQGLSYNYGISVDVDAGLIYFKLFQSAQLVDAYKEACRLVNEYVQGTAEFTEVDLVASRSSLIFSIIEEEETPAQASTQSMLCYLRGIGHQYNRRLLQKIPSVTIGDLQRVGRQYFASLFDPNRSKVVICCHPTKVDETVGELLSCASRDLKVIESLDDALLSDL